MNIDDFIDELKVYLRDNNLSPNSFAKKTGIGQSSISRILNGEVKKGLKKRTKEKLAKYFEIPFSLIEETPNIINDRTSFISRSSYKSFVHEIPIYDQLDFKLCKKETITVTSDIRKDAFAVLIMSETEQPSIDKGDILVVSPDLKEPCEQLEGKIIVLRENNNIIIRKSRYIESTLLLKGKSLSFFNSDSQEIMGWVTEIRKNRVIRYV